MHVLDRMERREYIRFGAWGLAWCVVLAQSGPLVGRVWASSDCARSARPRSGLNASYSQAIRDVYTEASALLDDLEDRAIVVGHSSAGVIITEAYRKSSERIKGLVYLSAFLLPFGKTPRDVMKMDSESLLPGCLEIDTFRGVSVVREECAKSVFYGDCSEEDTAWALGQLQPEPLIPPGPVTADTGIDESADRIPRFYIECLQDKALSPRVQRLMYTESRCDAVYSLPTSHSPFLSAPGGSHPAFVGY